MWLFAPLGGNLNSEFSGAGVAAKSAQRLPEKIPKGAPDKVHNTKTIEILWFSLDLAIHTFGWKPQFGILWGGGRGQVGPGFARKKFPKAPLPRSTIEKPLESAGFS